MKGAIGIAGQVIMEQNGVRNFRYISSVNIRVAHQVRGCADAVMPYLTSQGNVIQHTDHCTARMWQDDSSQRHDPTDCEWM